MPRGLSKFATVMEAAKLLDGREDAADWVAPPARSSLARPGRQGAGWGCADDQKLYLTER